MKKLKVAVLSLLVCLLFTGCGSTKTLTCTNTSEEAGISMDQKIEVKFKNKKVSNVKVEVNSKATSELIKTYWNTFASTLDAQYPNKDADGIKVSTKNDADKYEYAVSIELDLNKASKDALKEYDLEDIADSESDIDEVKKAAEASGYTCK